MYSYLLQKFSDFNDSSDTFELIYFILDAAQWPLTFAFKTGRSAAVDHKKVAFRIYQLILNQ